MLNILSNKTFVIGIPTINRWDILQNTMHSYLQDFPSTYFAIVDNGHQGIKEHFAKHTRVIVYTPKVNLGVSASWNLICKDVFYQMHIDNVLMLNDDIYLGRTEDEVKDFIIQNSDRFCQSTINWCSMVIPRLMFDKIGMFDEEFYPAYFEDNDYAYRMKLVSESAVVSPLLTPVVFNNSMTIKKDPSLNNNFNKNREYYIRKWGGVPEKETFKTPFGV